MRFLLLAALAALACRGERGAGPPPSAGRPRTEATAAGISDADLVAFVRWQREFNQTLSRQKAEIDAIQPDPSKPFDEAAREAGQRAGQVTERFAPEVRDLYRRMPLTDAKLERVEFVPTRPPDLPSVDRIAADSVTGSDFVRRSIAHELRMPDIEAATGPGYRATWFIDGRAGTTRVGSRWMWEVEPGRVLYVEEVGGDVGQPVIRSLQ